MKKKKLMLEQLDSSLKEYAPLRYARIPFRGWIRAIRDALGMTAKQLANRLDSTQQNVARIERDELAGSVTMRTMKHIAQSLDCTFVYALVPNSTLEKTIREQVEFVVKQHLSKVSHTMLLESQSLSNKEQERIYKQMVEEYLEKLPSYIWDVK
ncbi:MAG: mobile mystery protein A [Candidatus Sabulitectum sp.]|nr:mobile mystery protein A [Candidatus Sabulitectum sp.]